MTTADERAGLRLGLLGVAGAVVALVVVPLGVLVRDGWRPLRDGDADASRALTLAHGAARDVTLALTQLGAPVALELAALAVAAVLLRQARRRLALYVVVTVGGAELLSALAKLVVDRVRPCTQALSGCPHSTSFPSGHATGAAAFWTAAAVILLPALGRAGWVLAALVPLTVGATRVLLGVHYPSDVAAGLLLGWSWTAATTAVFAAWRDERAGRELPLEQGLQP